MGGLWGLLYDVVIMRGVVLEIVGIGIENMNIVVRGVDMIEEIGRDERVIGVRMRLGER